MKPLGHTDTSYWSQLRTDTVERLAHYHYHIGTHGQVYDGNGDRVAQFSSAKEARTVLEQSGWKPLDEGSHYYKAE